MDQISDCFPPKLFGAQFAQSELYRVQNVRLAGPVRAGYDRETAVEADCCFFPEGLETSQVNSFDIHHLKSMLAAACARNFVTLATHAVDRMLQRCEDKAWLHFHDDLYG